MIVTLSLLALMTSNAGGTLLLNCENLPNLNIVKGSWVDEHDCIFGTLMYYDGAQRIENTDNAAGNVIWFGSTNGATPDTDYNSADFTIEVEIKFKTNSGDAGILFRAQSVSSTINMGQSYYVGLYPGNDRVIFGRFNNGWTALYNLPYTINYGVRHKLRVEAHSYNYRVFVDNNLVIDNIVATEYTLGSIGLRTYHSPATFMYGEYTSLKCVDYPAAKSVVYTFDTPKDNTPSNKYIDNHHSYFHPITISGFVLFLLINNVFVCYWCVCKDNYQKFYQNINKVEEI
eukprot:87329_1